MNDNSFIRVTRNPYEEPHHVNLVVTASNGRTRGELEIYANATDLLAFSQALRSPPKFGQDIAVWELGSEEPERRFAFHFRIRVFQVSATGQCAVEVRLCNNGKAPEREIVEFSMLALPADLERLSKLFEQFGALAHRVLEWRVTEGELHEHV